GVSCCWEIQSSPFDRGDLRMRSGCSLLKTVHRFIFGFKNRIEMSKTQNIENVVNSFVQITQTNVAIVFADCINGTHDRPQSRACNVRKQLTIDYDFQPPLLDQFLEHGFEVLRSMSINVAGRFDDDNISSREHIDFQIWHLADLAERS